MTQREWDRLKTGVGAAIILAALLAMVYMLTGCAPSRPPANAAAPLQRLEEAAPRITGSADRIDAAAPGIPPVQVETAALRVVAGEVGESAAELKLTVSQQGAALERRDAQIEKLNDELKEERSKARALMARALAALGALCAIGLGASAVLLVFRPSKTAVAVAVGSAVTLAVSVGVSYYMRQIALVMVIVVAAAALIGLGYVVWYYTRTRKAVVEVVGTAEEAKARLLPHAKADVFDRNATEKQSKSTKALVQAARKKIGATP